MAVSLLSACPDKTSTTSDVLDALLDAGDDVAKEVETTDGGDTEVSPPTQCADFNPLRNAYFGDTHIHTALSLDAVLQGTRLTPADAYRFARGEAVGIQPYDDQGVALRTLQLARPLDFVALSDHAEFLGPVSLCQNDASAIYDSSECELFRDDPALAFQVLNFQLSIQQSEAGHPDVCGNAAELCLEAAKAPWDLTVALAEENTEAAPGCGFTAFAGYEWSGSPGTENLHRNVLFRNSQVPALPISYFDTPYEQSLWAALKTQCLDADTGCDVLAIPHNSNLSSGRMFASATAYVEAGFTGDDAAFRSRIEPLVEIFQHKGDSECDATATDEDCAFEDMPYANLSGPVVGVTSVPKRMDFVRTALAEGLLIAEQLGENPYELGIIASTDTHLGTPGAVAEDGHPGHGGAGTPARDALPEGLTDVIAFNPGGLAVVWAEENTRDALFDAMLRKETYGTSGPRIVLRFFGGWEYPTTLCDDSELVAQGYAGGVPMGGRLKAAPSPGGAPRFVIHAMQDAGVSGSPGTPLQRLQVVKGWVDNGEAKTKTFEVAGDANNGASVNLTNCAKTGAGAQTLCTVWTDPEFVEGSAAVYYVRVLENPSCRWSQHQCIAAGVDCSDPTKVPEPFEACCDAAIPKTIQERAWSSPIWYVP